MKGSIGLLCIAIFAIAGLWITQHESPEQEVLISIVLIVISVISIFLSLKTLSSER